MSRYQRSGRSGLMKICLRTGWMALLALSLIFMHGLGLSHSAPIDSAVATQTVPSGAVDHAGHVDPASPQVDQPGYASPEPGHAGTFTEACLAVLAALMVVWACFGLITLPWVRLSFGSFSVRVQQLCNRAMWWAHPRSHSLCVMRT